MMKRLLLVTALAVPTFAAAQPIVPALDAPIATSPDARRVAGAAPNAGQQGAPASATAQPAAPPAPVPVPAAGLLLAGGLGVLALRRKRG